MDVRPRPKTKTSVMKDNHLPASLDNICFPVTIARVVITEGELDAASCQEAMPGWPMVSLPSGAAAAKKSVQRHITEGVR